MLSSIYVTFILIISSTFLQLVKSFCNSPDVRRTTALLMAPRFDRQTERWEATKPSEEASEGYGPIGSLIRAGPLPFFQRIVNADQYEQAVLKYMANDGVDRMEAQGNMDAYFENPNDWAYQKLQERKGGPKKDFANANTSPKQLVLTGIWSLIVIGVGSLLVVDLISGKYP